MRYALDPELAPWAGLLPALPYDDIVAARALEAQILAAIPERETSVPVDVRHLTVPGPEGGDGVPVRVYTPQGGAGPRSALVYLHGGGFCLGSVALSHGGCSTSSEPARSFQHHIASLLREAGVEADHEMLAHAMLVFTNFETMDYLRDSEWQVTTARLQSTWADLVRLVTGGAEAERRASTS